MGMLRCHRSKWPQSASEKRLPVGLQSAHNNCAKPAGPEGVNLSGMTRRGIRVLAPRVPALRERGGDETDARVVRTHGDSTARAAHARRMHSTFVHTQLYEMCVTPPGTLARI